MPEELGAAGGRARLRGARAHRPRRRLRLARVRARGEALRRPRDHRRRGHARTAACARDACSSRRAGLREPLPAAHRRARAHAAEGEEREPAAARARPGAARGAERGARLPLRLRAPRARRPRPERRRRARRARSAASASTSSSSGRTSAATRAGTRALRDLAETLGVPTVATGDVHAHHPRRAALQDVLVAIRHRTSLEAASASGAATTRASCCAPAEMLERFPDDRDAVLRTRRDRRTARVRPDRGARLPLPRLLRRRRARDRPARRRSATTRSRSATRQVTDCYVAQARARLERSCADRRARPRRLLPPPLGGARARAGGARSRCAGPARRGTALPPGRGRGSSVGSIVCYLTGLSHVDPVAQNLSLGRFLNRELMSVPDIDLDFPRDIREKLIVARHRALRPRARRARRELLDLPRARRDPRRRQGARAAVRRARAARARHRRLERDAASPRSSQLLPDAERQLLSPRWRAFGELCARDRRPAAPHLAAPGRDGDLDAAARRARPRAAGGDGRAADLPVGQGLLRRRRLPQDRPARARDALGGRGLRRPDRAAARRADRPLADPARRPGRLRGDPARRHRRRLPDREPRADAEPAAHAAGEPRRPDRAGRARAARADPGQGRPPVHRRTASGCARTRRSCRRSTTRCCASRCARRSASSSSRTRCSTWRWRSPASAIGEAEGLRRAMSRKRSEEAIEAFRAALRRGRRAERRRRARRPTWSTTSSSASPASASRSRTRPRSGCSPTSRRGCATTTRPSSSARS